MVSVGSAEAEAFMSESCGGGFRAEVTMVDEGSQVTYGRRITWRQRPDGLVAIHINPPWLPPYQVTKVVIECSQGHIYPYEKHIWEVLECEGLRSAAPLQ